MPRRRRRALKWSCTAGAVLLGCLWIGSGWLSHAVFYRFGSRVVGVGHANGCL